jgi:voltage-gated potassium channel
MSAAINKKRLNILDRPIFVYLISMLTIFSAVSFSIETIPDLDKGVLTFLHYSEIVIVVFFTIEYFYRIYIAENKLKYILRRI